MTTKQQVADYVNSHIGNDITTAELGELYKSLTPETAKIWIKLLGDVSFLIRIRDLEE
jgi:hypothetical protein